MPVETFQVASGEQVVRTLTLPMTPESLAGMRAPAEVVVELETSRGRQLVGPLFVHADGEELVVYAEDAMYLRWDAGDLDDAVFPDVPNLLLAGEVGHVELGSGVDLSSTEGAWEFCLRWHAFTSDRRHGEDVYADAPFMPAAGVRALIWNDAWIAEEREPLDVWADQDGCFSVEATESTGYRVSLVSQVRVGAEDTLRFDVQTEPGDVTAGSQALKYGLPRMAAADPGAVRWNLYLDPGGDPRKVQYTVPYSKFNNAMAYGAYLLQRFDDELSTPLDDTPFTLTLHNEPNVHMSDGALTIPWAHFDRKFVYGHGFAHYLTFFLLDLPVALPHYDVNGSSLRSDLIGDCRSSSIADSAEVQQAYAHVLGSGEFHEAAAFEGFAHFVSAAAYNDLTEPTGVFTYYKNVDLLSAYNELDAGDYVVGLGLVNAGVPQNWRRNRCGIEADGSVSTEVDWLRALWALASGPDGSGWDETFTMFAEVTTTLDGAGQVEKLYLPVEAWRQAAAGVGRAAQWDAIAQEHGIHCPEEGCGL
jgi:hypothetical protein